MEHNLLPQTGTKSVTVYDLEFEKVADRGTAQNAEVDNNGIIEVVLVRTREEEIIEETDEFFKQYIDVSTIDKIVESRREAKDVRTYVESSREPSDAGSGFATEKGRTKFTAP